LAQGPRGKGGAWEVKNKTRKVESDAPLPQAAALKKSSYLHLASVVSVVRSFLFLFLLFLAFLGFS
jgi:hypothetical protein